LVATAIRWIGFAALATLVGSEVVQTLVLPPAGASVDETGRKLRRLALWSALLLIGTTAGELVTRAEAMAGGSLGAAVSAIPAVLARTHFGTLWIARFVVLALALAMVTSGARAARAVSLVLALAVAATTSLTGHAGDWGDLTFTAGVDWLHVVSMSAWTGGLIAILVGLPRDPQRWPPPLYAACVRRFSRLAGLCVVVVLLSGIYNAWVQLPGPSALWTTTYGRALALKLLLVIALIWWGAVNRYTIVSRLARHGAPSLAARCFRLLRLALLGGS